MASLLCHNLATKDTIPQIAEIYNTVRCPQGNMTLLGSDRAGKETQLVAPGFEDVKQGDADVPLEKLQALFEDFARRWDWVWKESAEGDRTVALQLFKSPETFQRMLPFHDTRLCLSNHPTTHRTKIVQRMHGVRKALRPLCAPQEVANLWCPVDKL